MADTTHSPKQYIEELKARFPKETLDDSYASPLLKQMWQRLPGDVEVSLADLTQQDYALFLFERIKGVLPERTAALIDEGVLAIGEVADPTPNAYCKTLDGARFAIVFNSGLRDFIYRVARVLGTRFEPHDAEPRPNATNFDECVQLITDIFFWYNETGRACGPSYSIREDQLVIASMLATEAETFFLAHEIAHAALQALRQIEGHTEDGKDSPDDEEFRADEIALRIVLRNAAGSQNSFTRGIAYAGVELALNIFTGLAELGVEFLGPHPPAHKRLAAIRKHACSCCQDEATYEQLTVLSSGLDAIFRSIIDRIKHPDHEAFLDRAAASVIADLDRLLDECTGGMVPDYVTFKSRAPDLFNQGYSYKLYSRIASAASDFFGNAAKISDQGEATGSASAWVAFQKYKLFLSLVMEMADPAKSLFEEALRLKK